MKHLKSESGFTFLELLATTMFIGIAFASIVEIFISLNGINRQSRNLVDAKQAALERIEDYRNSAYVDIPVGSPALDFSAQLPANLGSPKTGTVNVTETQTGLKRVDVFVSYREGNRTKQVELSTLITEEGIGQ